MPASASSVGRREARRAVALLAAVALVVQTGCAGRPPLPPALEPAGLGPVMIVASEREPELQLQGFARSRVEGGVTGAGGLFLSCAAGLGHGACAGPYCGAVVILWLALCGVAGVAGGVVGAAVSPPAETVRAAEQALATAISPRTIQSGLREQVVAAGRRRGLALSNEPDTIVETALVHVGTSGKGFNSPLLLEMRGQARVLRARDRAELRVVALNYQGEAHRLEQWAAGNGARLLRELERGYEALGETLYEAIFQRYPFPDRDLVQGAGTLAVAFGLAPVYPGTRGTPTGDHALARLFEWAAVDSARPTLRWQPFPRDADVARAPADMARVRAVTYDLVIARERNLAPTSEIYRREGLLEPYHRPEVALARGAYYFWSVRARFELDGRERVTEWSTTHYSAFGEWHAPSTHSYRFRTP